MPAAAWATLIIAALIIVFLDPGAYVKRETRC